MTLLACLPTRALAEAVGPVDGVELVVWSGDGPPPRPEEIELLVPDYAAAPDVLGQVDAMPRLRVVQLQTAGYDGLIELVPDGVVLASGRGVHDDATAELALGLTIASLRGIDLAARERGDWPRDTGRRSLADSNVTILGYGSIGRAIAERLLACKARVTAVTSAPRSDDLVGSVVTSADVDWPAQHVVVVVLPLSEATHRLVDAGFLARLADGALVVNVGRGPLLDTSAVLAAAGRLRFALDVTDPEPLPAGHPLWTAPGVLITPHIAGGTTAMLPRIAALVRDQAARLRDGQPLVNLVSR